MSRVPSTFRQRDDMKTVRLKYIDAFEDRHGHMRYYFRRWGRRVPLPGPVGSAKFMAAYHQALGGPLAAERLVTPEKTRRPKRGVVYFLQQGSGGPVKIGFTHDLRARVRELQTGSPDRLVVLKAMHGGMNLEAELHERFAEFRLEGEWFAPNPCLFDYIQAVR